MTKDGRFTICAALTLALPLCALFAAGCQNQGQAPPPPVGQMGGGNAPGGVPGNSAGGPGVARMGGGPGGGRMGGGPVAESATGAEIFQAKCGCHGPEGKGGRGGAPVLAGITASESDIVKTVHDGKGKMPAFGSQLSDAQIKKVAAYLKQLKA
jgi:cytochrome c6